MQRTAIIIGASPAGVTVAYELLTRTDIIPFGDINAGLSAILIAGKNY